MRIDEFTNAATLRLVTPVGEQRSAAPQTARIATDIGGSMPDTSSGGHSRDTAARLRVTDTPTTAPSATRSPVEMPSASDLAAQPRFAALVEMMERLTGREVTLLPPTTITLGRRKSPQPIDHGGGSAPSAVTHVVGVRAVAGGEAYRIDTSASVDGGVAESAQIDIGMDVIRAHAHSASTRTGALRIQISAEAVTNLPTEPIRVQHVGADLVKAVPQDVRFDRQA